MKDINNQVPEPAPMAMPIKKNAEELSSIKSILDEKIHSYSVEQLQEISLFSFRIKMIDYLNSEVQKETMKGAGLFLKELLNALNIKQNKFAEYIEMKPSNLSKILNGDRKIGFELSLILQQLFNIESDLWLRIQSKNRLFEMSTDEVEQFSNYKLKDLVS